MTVQKEIRNRVEKLLKIKQTNQQYSQEEKDALSLICEICKLAKLKGDATDEEIEKAVKPDNLTDEREEVDIVLKKIEEIKSGIPAFTQQNSDIIKNLKRNIDCIVLVVHKDDLTPIIKGDKQPYQVIRYEVKGELLKNRHVIVAGEKMKLTNIKNTEQQQSANSLGTGWLYKPNHKVSKCYVVTAGHVLFPMFRRKIQLEDIRFLRQFTIQDLNNQNAIEIAASDVYKLKNSSLEFTEDYQLSSDKEDWAVAEIVQENGDSIENCKFCLTDSDIETDKGIANKKVYSLGHGWSTPLKFSPDGKILDIDSDDDRFFTVKLDAFSGASGAPIFSADNHKVIGILVRGQNEVYFKEKTDKKKKEVTPGVLASKQKGEICQQITFLKVWEKEIENTKNVTPSSTPQLSHIELLPFTYLEKIEKTNIYQLYLNFSTASRKVIFPAYPFKEGSITVIECYLDAADDTKNNHTKKYLIQGPDNVKDTDETIEIRVFDKGIDKNGKDGGVFHITTLDYISAQEQQSSLLNSNEEWTTKTYWAICVPKVAYEKDNLDNELIGLSLGYFETATNFVKSDIVSVKVEISNGSLILKTDRGEGTKISLDKNATKPTLTIEKDNFSRPNNKEKSIVFSRLGGNGTIKKGPGMKSRPKPTQFINPEDVG